MSHRDVVVVLHVTEEMSGIYRLDEADYLEWLAGDDDTPERVREYLISGDEFEVISSVYDEARLLGQTEIWSSEIEEVR